MVVERCVYLATRDPGRGGKSSHTHQGGGEERSCTAHTNIYEKSWAAWPALESRPPLAASPAATSPIGPDRRRVGWWKAACPGWRTGQLAGRWRSQARSGAGGQVLGRLLGRLARLAGNELHHLSHSIESLRSPTAWLRSSLQGEAKALLEKTRQSFFFYNTISQCVHIK